MLGSILSSVEMGRVRKVFGNGEGGWRNAGLVCKEESDFVWLVELCMIRKGAHRCEYSYQ